MSHQIRTYTELRKQIHDDLRIQHPEWVQLDGESPVCDSYEARLVELFDAFQRREREGTKPMKESLNPESGYAATPRSRRSPIRDYTEAVKSG